jgi:hypothetical protein
MKLSSFLLLLLISTSSLAGEVTGSAGTGAQVEPRYLVDMPTAGILKNGMVAMGVQFYEMSGMLVSLEAGAFNRLTFGLSYGGTNIIGSGTPDWNRYPGVNIRFRVLDETEASPAIAVGFDSQGKDRYLTDLNRYTFKSPGFFASASKYFTMLGYLGLHGGVNYSLENGDGNKNINFYVGADKSFGRDISLLFEYNFGINDNQGDSSKKGLGFINAGVRWSIGGGFTLEFDYKNILNLKKTTDGSLRVVRLEYVQAM